MQESIELQDTTMHTIERNEYNATVSSSLLVPQLKLSDAGDYTCVASNRLGADKHVTKLHFASEWR